jgi:uncharacterized membrane protein YfcA
VLIFGVDIKTAGSASILISLGVVSIGLWRYWRADALPTGRGAQRITTAMAASSIIGATVDGLAVAYAPVTFLQVLLGCVLLAAAAKTASSAAKKSRHDTKAAQPTDDPAALQLLVCASSLVRCIL